VGKAAQQVAAMRSGAKRIETAMTGRIKGRAMDRSGGRVRFWCEGGWRSGGNVEAMGRGEGRRQSSPD
jgi:hypothetical protein